MTDEQFTISNLTNEAFLESFVSEFELNEIVPNKIVDQIKTIFDFDYLEHYFTVINNTPDWEQLWEDSLELSKEEYVRTYLLNPAFAKDNQLLFPNLSNFDSINPIFWNTILRKNTAWLDKYKVKNGTYNQTN
jgi:hypothetical protein